MLGRLSCARASFDYFLELLANYSSVEPVDRDVEPISFLTFDKEVCQPLRVWRIVPGLSN